MKLLPLVLACAAVTVTAGCSSSGKSAGSALAVSATGSAAATTFDLDATLTIKEPYSTGVDAMTAGAPCIGISNDGVDYEDIGAGVPVTVTDGSGATAGVGTLAAGKMTIVDLASRECVFDVKVTGVLSGKPFYSLTIGDHSTQQMKAAEFEAAPSFTLSGNA